VSTPLNIEELSKAAETLALAETCAEGGLHPSKARQFVAACELVSNALPGLLAVEAAAKNHCRCKHPNPRACGCYAGLLAALRGLEKGDDHEDAEQG